MSCETFLTYVVSNMVSLVDIRVAGYRAERCVHIET